MKYISRKQLYVGLCVLFIFLTVLYSSAYASTPVLKNGMSNSYVSQLQQDLKKTGFYNYKITGYFGNVTETSVRNFQRQHGLLADGKAGSGTLSKLSSLLKKRSTTDSPSTGGSIVYYNSKLSQSKILSENIQNVLNGIVSGGKKRMTHSPQKADFYVLRNSNVPSVLVETAFITNTQDRQLLMNNSFRNKVVLAVVQGIENYLD